MPDSEKHRATEGVVERRAAFDVELSHKRKYPVEEFRAFVQAARRYVRMTKNDLLIHKSVIRAVNGLREYLAAERKRVRGDVLFEADRLECLLFSATIPRLRAMDLRDCESRWAMKAQRHIHLPASIHVVEAFVGKCW
jgi:hypothetical protein